MLPHATFHEAFAAWFAEASTSEPRVPDAMQIATSGAGHQPTVRTVLLKDHGPEGFTFYTNLESRKAHDLADNPRIAAVFHWKSLERQVVIDGRVEPVSDATADAYFATRERGSQLGAWASRQSRPLSGREQLEEAIEAVTRRFEGHEVPRPPFWSGYLLRPHRVEFWQGMPSRLHVRTVYLRHETAGEAQAWTKDLAYP